MRIGMSVTHAAHLPQRRHSFQRLLAALSDDDSLPAGELWHVESERAPAHVWSMNQWTWGAAAESADWICFLQDDALPCERFLRVLSAALASAKSDIVCLTHSGLLVDALSSCRARGVHWMHSPDGLIGYGYAIRQSVLSTMLSWFEQWLVPGAREAIQGEDRHINLFAMATGIPIAHTLPALVDHDTSIDSTWDNPKHALIEDRPVYYDRAPGLVDATQWVTDAGAITRVYRGNYRFLLSHTRPGAWNIPFLERYYAIAGDRLQ